MITIVGYELVDAGKRDRTVDAHCDLVTRAREFDGCMHVAITADSVDPERINSVEVWRDAKQWSGGGPGQGSGRRRTQVHVSEAVRRHRRRPTLLN